MKKLLVVFLLLAVALQLSAVFCEEESSTEHAQENPVKEETEDEVEGEEDEGGEEEQEEEEENWNDPDVLKLTTETLENSLKENEMVMVEFYAPWCPHCKQLADTYQQLAVKVKEEKLGIPVTKIDGTKNTEAAQKYEIQGFPTVKFFKNGRSKDYKGKRTVEGFLEFLKKQLEPGVKKINSVEEAEKVVEQAGVKVFGFFSSDSSVFEEVGEHLKDKISFYSTSNEDVMKKYEAKDSQVIIFRDFEERELRYDGKMEFDDLVAFVSEKSMPAIAELNFETVSDLLQKEKPFCLLFSDFATMDETKELLEELTPVAKEFSSKLTFVYLDNEKFGSHQERLGLDGSVPNMAIDDYMNNVHFILKEKINAENVREFVRKYADGELSSHRKSEPVPEKDDGPVKTVVGSTFEDIVYDSSKDVMVMLYAPWCGHCKQLHPIYEKLAEKYTGSAEVVIAKMDATTNDAPPAIKIEGFPTVLFFPKESKESPISYSGDRTLADLTSFVEKNKSPAKAAESGVREEL